MSKKLLLIHQGKSFMLNTIVKNLHDAAYEVVEAQPVMEEIAAHKNETDLLLMYLGDYVDDTAMNLTVVKGLLKQTRMQLDTALSGYKCLEMVQARAYDVILLDHRMPGLDGLETLAKFKELARQPDFPNRRTPVIALTANAISGAREEYMAAGFDDYLTKPIDSHQLETMLQKYLLQELEGYQLPDEAAAKLAQVKAAASIPDWVALKKILQ